MTDERHSIVKRIEDLLALSTLTEDQRNRAIAFAVAGEVLRPRGPFSSGEPDFGRAASAADQIIGSRVVFPDEDTDEFRQHFEESELKVESVPGAEQKVTEEFYGVKITHLPSGIASTATAGKSRLENMASALDRLAEVIQIKAENDRPIFDEQDPLLGELS